mmetsp:Transcript_12358/g.26527  ORF Transcript_12358/g.26527 Transcript_12358/m.26527 type:complete len:207 (+) Transcript_12358:998-1618(+)
MSRLKVLMKPGILDLLAGLSYSRPSKTDMDSNAFMDLASERSAEPVDPWYKIRIARFSAGLIVSFSIIFFSLFHTRMCLELFPTCSPVEYDAEDIQSLALRKKPCTAWSSVRYVPLVTAPKLLSVWAIQPMKICVSRNSAPSSVPKKREISARSSRRFRSASTRSKSASSSASVRFRDDTAGTNSRNSSRSSTPSRSLSSRSNQWR